MQNDIGDAKQEVDLNPCTPNDVEICFKGVHEIYTVDEDGQEVESKEVYGDESYPSYYYCLNCQESFNIERDDFGRIWYDKEDTWKQVKEHFNG